MSFVDEILAEQQGSVSPQRISLVDEILAEDRKFSMAKPGIRTLENIGQVYPVLETAAQIATSAYGLPVSGIAGLLATPFGKGEEAVEATQRALIYEPQTERGRELTETSAYPLKAFRFGAKAVGEKTLEISGSPVLATAAHTVIEALPALIPGARLAFKKLQASNWYRRVTIPERAVVIKSLNSMLDQGMSEAQILRKWNNPTWRKEALAKRLKPETPSPEFTPETDLTTSGAYERTLLTDEFQNRGVRVGEPYVSGKLTPEQQIVAFKKRGRPVPEGEEAPAAPGAKAAAQLEAEFRARRQLKLAKDWEREKLLKTEMEARGIQGFYPQPDRATEAVGGVPGVSELPTELIRPRQEPPPIMGSLLVKNRRRPFETMGPRPTTPPEISPYSPELAQRLSDRTKLLPERRNEFELKEWSVRRPGWQAVQEGPIPEIEYKPIVTDKGTPFKTIGQAERALIRPRFKTPEGVFASPAERGYEVVVFKNGFALYRRPPSKPLPVEQVSPPASTTLQPEPATLPPTMKQAPPLPSPYPRRTGRELLMGRKGAGIAEAPAKPEVKEVVSDAVQGKEKGQGEKVKEPWEMTRENFDGNHGLYIGRNEKDQLIVLRTNVKGTEANFNEHEQAVRIAVKQGKPVPPEVLKEYPELAKPSTQVETKPKRPKYIGEAVRAYRQGGGDRDIDWIYRQMSDADRKAFDDYLIKIKHPLAYEAGTNEGRFKLYVKEIVTLARPTPKTETLYSLGPDVVIEGVRQLKEKVRWLGNKLAPRYTKNLKSDMELFQSIWTNPWHEGQKSPLAKSVLDVQLRQTERNASEFGEKQETLKTFRGLTGKAREWVGQKLTAWDVKGKDYVKKTDILKQAGWTDEMITGYLETQKLFEWVRKDWPDFLEEIHLWPYRKKPFYQELKAALEKNGLPKFPDEDLYNAFEKLKDGASEIRKLRERMGSLPGYFPRVRNSGRYVVDVLDKEGVKVWSEWTKTKPGAELLARKLRKKFPDAEEPTVTRKDAIPETVFQSFSEMDLEWFMEEALNQIREKGEFDPKLIDALNREMINVTVDELKGRGWSRHTTKRAEGPAIGGYKTKSHADIIDDYLSGYIGTKNKIRATLEFAEAVSAIPKDMTQTYLYWSRFAKDMTRNTTQAEVVGARVRSIAYAWYLMGNMKSGLLQISQFHTQAVPELGKFTKGAGRKLHQAAIDIARGKMESDTAMALQVATKKRVIDAHYVKELLGTAEQKLSERQKGSLSFLLSPISWFERYLRSASFVAGYRVFRAQGMGKPEAWKAARDYSYNSFNLYGKANLPEPMRAPGAAAIAARQAYTFGVHPHNYVLWMSRTGKKHTKQLGKALALLVAWGGAAAVPFLDDMMDAYEKLTGDPVRKKIDRSTGGLGMTGIPGAAGVDLSGSLKIGLPFYEALAGESDPTEAIYSVYTNLARRMYRGTQRTIEGEYLRALEEVLPVAGGSILQARREATEGVTTARNVPVWDYEKGGALRLTTPEAILKGASFQPARKGRAVRSHKVFLNISRFYDRKRMAIYNRLRRAVRDKSPKKVRQVLEDIADYRYNIRQEGLYTDETNYVIPDITDVEIDNALADRPDKREAAFNR